MVQTTDHTITTTVQLKSILIVDFLQGINQLPYFTLPIYYNLLSFYAGASTFKI